jgi:hypothetical protein
MKASILTALTLAALALAATAHADYSCETVARNGEPDPDGRFLRSAFGSEVAINSSGDALFTARPTFAKVRLYLYRNGGVSETIAEGNTAAPNGGAFRPSKPFHSISINEAGDLSFVGRLRPGQGIFVREDGGVLETAAETTGPSPNGGIYDEFPSVSRINSIGQVAFAAEVVGAPSGVFLYDAATDSASTAIETGDATAGGRVICEALAVGLGDSGAIAIRALVATPACLGNPRVEAILLARGGPPEEVALVGEASPIGGTVYANLDQAPVVNAGDKVAFRADVMGLVNATGLFLHDPAGPATTVVVRRGDGSPAGGSIGKITGFDLSDDDRVFFRSSISTSPARFGVFAFDGSSETVLVKTSAPPAGTFAPGAVFSNLSTPGVSKDGGYVGLYAKVRDAVPPRSRRAILRCTP